MARTIIAIDIDDVLADSTESLRLSVNSKHGVDLTKQHYRIPGPHKKYYERVWEANGIGDKAVYDDFDAEMILDQSHVAIVDGADAAIKRLKEKYDVILITARPDSWGKATRGWFKKNFGGDIELYFSQGYFNETGKTKGQLCKEFGAEWLIDDVPDNCQTALDEGVGAILFGEYGWHENIPDNLVQCKTWDEAVEFLLNAR